MFSAKVLGGITALIIAVAVGAIFTLLPDSGASQLMRKAFHLGWPGGLVIVILMLYFQFGRKNDPRRGELVFKSVIGLLGYSMLFIAIANYAMNFNDESPGVPGEPRFLPVSLVMFTVSCFMMAMYFKGVRVLLQIGGFMFFVAACLAGFGNWLPQVKTPRPMAEFFADAARHELRLIGSLQPDAQQLKNILAETDQRPASVLMMVGPEGDFTPAELNVARANGCRPITLGPIILRVETAAIYCLSVLSYELLA